MGKEREREICVRNHQLQGSYKGNLLHTKNKKEGKFEKARNKEPKKRKR